MRALILTCDAKLVKTYAPLAQSRGFGLELQLFPPLDDASAVIANYAPSLEGFTGLRTSHGPYADLCPGSPDPMVRQVAAHRIGQVLPIARSLGAGPLVVHHGYVPHSSQVEQWVLRSCAFWRAELAGLPQGMSFHVENYFDYTPDVLLRVAREVNDPRLGICLDIGHCHAISRTPLLKWIEALGDRVTYVHLHDNDGTADQHRALGQGNAPVADALAALEKLAPQAIWCLEGNALESLAWLETHGFRL
jgi:sugar phosphate isomerase/epimerase